MDSVPTKQLRLKFVLNMNTELHVNAILYSGYWHDRYVLNALMIQGKGVSTLQKLAHAINRDFCFKILKILNLAEFFF